MDGSYIFGEFSDNEKELERLEMQGRIGLEIEKKIFKLVGVAKGLNVLDIGCGPGLTSLELAKIVNPGNVIGVDANELLLKRALFNKNKSNVLNANFELQDIYDLTLDKSSIDFAYARLIFQHLSSPVKAMESILQTLKTGGKLCIVDVDDQFLTLYPDNEYFTNICEKAKICQSSRGGDKSIGRKLLPYLEQAGYRNVKLHLQLVTSRDIELRNFINITTKFKAQQIDNSIMKKEEVKCHLEQLDALSDDTLGIIGIFVAIGEK